jgi:hypothetical protein
LPGRVAKETSCPCQVGRSEAGGEDGTAQREVRRPRRRYALARQWAKAPSPPRITEAVVAGAEGVSTELSMDDYLVGGVAMFNAQMGLPPAGEFFLNGVHVSDLNVM